MANRLTSRLAGIAVIALLSGSVVAIAVAAITGESAIRSADVGRLDEPTWPLPSSVPLPLFTDATDEWGLHQITGGFGEPMAGGIATGDLDRDGDLDLASANGDLLVMTWNGRGYDRVIELDVGDAMAVGIADVDGDGWPDLLVGSASDTDVVVWGGPWVGTADGTGPPPQQTTLDADGRSAGLLAAELTGDELVDIVRLGLGDRTGGAADILWVGQGARTFESRILPGGERLSLAGEIADVDDDGLLDIWITRDVGWDEGPDSILSRGGDPLGTWTDVADPLGLALEIDGMGVTVADLAGDHHLDGYVSDLGDNEVMVRRGDRFRPLTDTGGARIRPPGQPRSVISSSWSTGAIDANLDGRLDLAIANGGFPDGGVRNKVPNTRVVIEDTPSLLLGVGDGRFVDVWERMEIPWTGAARGMSIGDVDDDGDDDILLATVDGRVAGMRNETLGPTVTVRASPGCLSAGAVVDVTGDEAAYRALLSAHSFAGAHAAAVAVGVPDGEAAVRVIWPGGGTPDPTIVASDSRQTVEVDCPP